MLSHQDMSKVDYVSIHLLWYISIWKWNELNKLGIMKKKDYIDKLSLSSYEIKSSLDDVWIKN